MNAALIFALSLIDKAAKLVADRTGQQFTDAWNDLAAQLTPDLPKKDDGTPWTVEDVQAAADEARSVWQQVADDSAPATPAALPQPGDPVGGGQ
jgi:hypothetical protein